MQDNSIQNPFLFLQPYGLKDHYILKGREKEGAALMALLKWKDIIIVYGKSGQGKTSFINYTLSDRINKVSWIPIRVTRLLNINESLNHNIYNAINAKSVDDAHKEAIVEDNILNKDMQTNKSIASRDSIELITELYKKWNRPIYLIIDQLEELFLIGGEKETEEFLHMLQRLMEATEISKKIILVLREEHLGYIQEVERILNGVFQDALYVKEIKKESGPIIFESLLTSTNPEKNEQLGKFGEKLRAANLKELLIRSCTDGDNFNAQKMQILLFLLWDKIYQPGNDISTENVYNYVFEICSSSNPLADYLGKTVNETLATNARLLKAPYWFILRNSISKAETKKPVAESELFNLLHDEIAKTASPEMGSQVQRNDTFRVSIKDVKQYCDDLERKKILQCLTMPIKTDQPERYFQLRHDTLVPAIRDLDPELALRFPRIVSLEEQLINPYQGLGQYDSEDGSRRVNVKLGRRRQAGFSSPKLCGREAVIREYAEFLNNTENKCLVIVGDSGTGKSSLVKGGLLPWLQASGYETTTMQPGPNLKNFSSEIQTYITRNKVLNSGSASKKSCLYIDQFEECYTFREANPGEKKQFRDFLNFLNDAISGPENHLKLVVSIRHDYAHEFDRNLDEWRKFKKLLRYPNLDEIFEIIVAPAYDRGVSFEPADLPETIAADAINTSYFLPLLSFAMATQYKNEVCDSINAGNQPQSPALTDKGYKQIGGIVKCLQNEFTRRFQQLPEDEKRLFPELMARMIIIRDTIPKAQPLPIARINFNEPGKAHKATEVLNKFTPEFFRKRDIFIHNEAVRSYEPIHDSLLIYCDEIRQIVNKVQEPRSQMYIQPLLEAAVKEWKGQSDNGHNGSSDQQPGAGNRLLEVITRRHKDLEPLFEFVKDDVPVTNGNWLFKEEMELVVEGKKIADTISHTNKVVMEQQLRQANMEKEQAVLLQDKLKAENERAYLEREKANAEHELRMAEARKKEQELEVETLRAQSLAAETQYKSERRKRLLLLLAAILVILAAVAAILYQKNLISSKEYNTRIALKEDSLKSSNAQAAIERQYSQSLAIEKQATDSALSELEIKDKENKGLIDKLRKNGQQLQIAVNNLEIAKKELQQENLEKDKILNEKDSINKDLTDAIIKLRTAEKIVDSLQNERLITLARFYRTISPALSYRLAGEALRQNAKDPVAANIRTTLSGGQKYFESMIVEGVNNFSVSRDGTRIATVHADPQNANNSQVSIWGINGKQFGEPVTISSKVSNVEFSHDNRNLMLMSDNSIIIYDGELGRTGNMQPLPDLQFARFAEYENRLFAISGNKIQVFKIEEGNFKPDRDIKFTADGPVNNARMHGIYLTIITSKGISYIDLASRTKLSSRNLPQSYILNGSKGVLAMEKPRIGKFRRLTYFDTAMHEQYSYRVPDKAYNLITGFANSPDGRFAIIKFNEKDNIIQFQQQQQQQQQKQSYNTRSNINMDHYLLLDSLYFIDIKTGKLTTIRNGGMINGAFIMSANSDSLFEYSSGSIRKIPIDRQSSSYRSPTMISDNTIFKEVQLAGPRKYLVVSLDDKKQLKLWRYGSASDLDGRQLLWTLSKEELEKLLSVK